MAKPSKLSNEEQVTGYFEKLTHPLRDVVDALRTIILNTDKEIAEQIKWTPQLFIIRVN